MTNRAARRREARLSESSAWKARHDNLLTILNAVLLAYGEGPDARLAVYNRAYAGRMARPVDIVNLGDRIVLSLGPSPEDAQKEEPDE